MSDQCNLCKFYKKSDDEWGECRRYAPKPASEHADLIPALLGPIAKSAFDKLNEDDQWDNWKRAIEASGDWNSADTAFFLKWPLVSSGDFCGEFVSA